eukprot:5331794-Prymnesium_polylepis.2
MGCVERAAVLYRLGYLVERAAVVAIFCRVLAQRLLFERRVGPGRAGAHIFEISHLTIAVARRERAAAPFTQIPW